MTAPSSIRVLVHQGGPITEPLSTTALTRLSAELDREWADLAVLSELALSPYFSTRLTVSHGSAVRLDGPEVGQAVAIAARHGTLVVLPFAELAGRGVLRNSCALVGPDGPIPGRVVSGPRAGTRAQVFAKVHLAENTSAQPGVHEKYHFVAGNGFLVWDTPLGRIAPLICYDRSFPESWRTVADAGAEVVVVPIATSRPERVRMLEAELAVAAMQNGVFVVAACKAGTETTAGGTVTYSGGSLVIGPDGTVVDRAADGGVDVFLRAELEREAFARYERTFHYRRDRQPSVYLRPSQRDEYQDSEASDA